MQVHVKNLNPFLPHPSFPTFRKGCVEHLEYSYLSASDVYPGPSNIAGNHQKIYVNNLLNVNINFNCINGGAWKMSYHICAWFRCLRVQVEGFNSRRRYREEGDNQIHSLATLFVLFCYCFMMCM